MCFGCLRLGSSLILHEIDKDRKLISAKNDIFKGGVKNHQNRVLPGIALIPQQQHKVQKKVVGAYID